jgi:hypothetical protein
METFLILEPSEVPDMITSINAKRTGGNAANKIGAVLGKQLRALFSWCHERSRQDLPLDPWSFC